MNRVNATTLRRELFRVLERVKRGETVEITRNGRPVARLIRVAPVDWRDQVNITPETIGDDDSVFAPLDDVWEAYE